MVDWDFAAPSAPRTISVGLVKEVLPIRLDLSCPVRNSARLWLDMDFLYIRTVDNDPVFLVVKYPRHPDSKQGRSRLRM